MKAIPQDLACTSLPQTWHAPRGPKIAGSTVENIEVRGYSKTELGEGPLKAIQTTLYNPLRSEVKWGEHYDTLQKHAPEILVLDAIKENPRDVPSKFGQVPAGSVLSYQQRLDDNVVLNIYDGVCFPSLPVTNAMVNSYQVALNQESSLTLDGLKLLAPDIHKFEKQTRLQSRSSLWFRLRKNRITASNVGEIFKRRKNETVLVQRLKSTRRVTTAAMRQGIALEPTAAFAYAEKSNKTVNLYPCGIIISETAPWIAASPDRKVYNPHRFPQFGLLEIKCPQVTSVQECKYLVKNADGTLKLKRNHNYYYQVLTQLAVTGLEWCDLFVWCSADSHQETIYLNKDVWQSVKDKIDAFYFNHFI